MAEKGLVRVEVAGLLGGVDELADLGGTLDGAAAGLVAADVCLLAGVAGLRAAEEDCGLFIARLIAAIAAAPAAEGALGRVPDNRFECPVEGVAVDVDTQA